MGRWFLKFFHYRPINPAWGILWKKPWWYPVMQCWWRAFVG